MRIRTIVLVLSVLAFTGCPQKNHDAAKLAQLRAQLAKAEAKLAKLEAAKAALVKQAAAEKAKAEAEGAGPEDESSSLSQQSRRSTGQAEPTQVDASRVQVGQRYIWRPILTEAGPFTTKLSRTWVVDNISEDKISYTVVGTIEMSSSNPNIPSQPAKTTKTPSWHPLKVSRANQEHRSEPVGEEAITVGGETFGCLVYEMMAAGKKTKVWVSNRWPRTIKSMNDGKVVVELVKIE